MRDEGRSDVANKEHSSSLLQVPLDPFHNAEVDVLLGRLSHSASLRRKSYKGQSLPVALHSLNGRRARVSLPGCNKMEPSRYSFACLLQ